MAKKIPVLVIYTKSRKGKRIPKKLWLKPGYTMKTIRGKLGSNVHICSTK